MRKTIVILLLALAAAVLPAESVRIGAAAGVELLNRPTYRDLSEEFDDQANIIPGLYWEVLFDHLGIGMSCLGKFDRLPAETSTAPSEWFFDWIGTWDVRYHLTSQWVLDPFVEAGLGCAGRVELTDYEEFDVARERQPLELSLFGQVGGGLALRLEGLHVGARLNYRFLNDPPPATQFEPYPLKSFHFDLFAGLSL
jgi:hypothetical protein